MARRPGHRHLIVLEECFANGVFLGANVLLVDRPVGRPVDGHLIVLAERLANGVLLGADVLLIHRSIGGPGHRHLVVLVHGLADGVFLHADALVVHWLADRVLANHVVIFPDLSANGVTLRAVARFKDGLANGVGALLHHRADDGAVLDAGVVLGDGLIADPVAHRGRAQLIGALAAERISAGATVRRLGGQRGRTQPGQRRAKQQGNLEPHLGPPRNPSTIWNGSAPLANPGGKDQPGEMCQRIGQPPTLLQGKVGEIRKTRAARAEFTAGAVCPA